MSAQENNRVAYLNSVADGRGIAVDNVAIYG